MHTNSDVFSPQKNMHRFSCSGDYSFGCNSHSSGRTDPSSEHGKVHVAVHAGLLVTIRDPLVPCHCNTESPASRNSQDFLLVREEADHDGYITVGLTAHTCNKTQGPKHALSGRLLHHGRRCVARRGEQHHHPPASEHAPRRPYVPDPQLRTHMRLPLPSPRIITKAMEWLAPQATSLMDTTPAQG